MVYGVADPFFFFGMLVGLAGNGINGGRIVNDEIPTGDVEQIGTSANPIWNHCAKL